MNLPRVRPWRWLAAAAIGIALAIAPAMAAARAGHSATPLETAPAKKPDAAARKDRRHEHDPLKLPADLEIPTYQAGPMPFKPGATLVFSVSWIGIPVANAYFRVRDDPGRPTQWTAEAIIKTNRLADLFYPMRDYIREDFARASFAPSDAYIRQNEKHRIKEFKVTFDRPRRRADAVEFYRGRMRTRRFAGGNPFGPLSGAVMALSQIFAPGRQMVFDVISGRYRFVFDFKVAGHDRIVTPLGDFQAWRVIPSLAYVSEGDVRSSARSVTVWVSQRQHLPVRIQSRTFVGLVRADLIRIDPPGATSAAKHEAMAHKSATAPPSRTGAR